MNSSQQLYLRDLLDFAELRVRDADGEPLTGAQLAAIFHQPFVRLALDEFRAAAERPLPQVRLAVEILRHLGDDQDAAAEAAYRETAFDSMLAPWGVSYAELQAVRTADEHGDEDAQEIRSSLAERLQVAPQHVNELLEASKTLTEEQLEALFGLLSTRRDQLSNPAAPPKLLLWQRERLSELHEDPTGDDRDGAVASARQQAERTLEQTLQAAVDAAETEALPWLRDSLVARVGARLVGDADAKLDLVDTINALTRQLAVDFGNSGQVRTTRSQQAVETLQTLLFGLRTGWLGQDHSSVFPAAHPAAAWKLAIDEHYTREDFDEDWHWLRRYDTWRSAIQVFLHADNALLPELLEESSPHHRPSNAFIALLNRLRTVTRLTPREVRALVNGAPQREEGGYLAMLRVELGSDGLPPELQKNTFVITEELTDDDLEERQRGVERYFHDVGLVPDPEEPTVRRWLYIAPNWLKEIYFFVPLTLALHLQRQGQFLAALAWYRTIYAYNWEVGRRKIFYGLIYEEGLDLGITRPRRDWLRQGLNPHDIATKRGYAYTRFALQSIAGCLLDFADAEFTATTTASLARARSLYVNALELLQLPEMLPPEDERAIGNPRLGTRPVAENPAIKALREHARLSLDKLRSGRNIAGMARPQRPEPATEAVAAPFLDVVSANPTIYRYRVLIERAQRLVAIAQQIEASFLSAAEKADAAAYDLLQARQDLALSQEQVALQDLRVDEAATGIELAQLQETRARELRDNYQSMIRADLNSYERELIQSYRTAGIARVQAAEWGAIVDISRAHGAIANPMQVFSWFASLNMRLRQVDATTRAIYAETRAQMTSFRASHERRREEWRRQQGLARRDIDIGRKQIVLAEQQQRTAVQERGIAQLRTEHAAVTLDFLANKFTNAELYEWMSGVLNRVYRFFLQQATATALLAQNQLAFERQEKLPSFVQQDYWRPPSEGKVKTGSENSQPDRRGLTGSARLLQDIYKLDQFAFKTRERKLELSQTFSLARLFPFEFELFRHTGRLSFATPMELFDRGFPGHYLRLIKRVSVSVLALVPPTDGIRASLANSGISRVVIGPDVFRTVEVQRSPELIAFTSPMNATGLFTLAPEDELLLPFEGQGVDTSWLLDLPQAANAFDFRTVADVLLTIDYTAQHSAGYRRQVIAHFDRSLAAEQPFSFRQQFADQWYELHNPDRSEDFMTIRVETRRSDFPPHIDDLSIEHLLLFFARADGAEFELPVASLRFSSLDGDTIEAGGAQTVDGIISTRRANGGSWKQLQGQPPLGKWELALPNTEEVRERFADEQIEDILFVIGFKGTAPAWPV